MSRNNSEVAYRASPQIKQTGKFRMGTEVVTYKKKKSQNECYFSVGQEKNQNPPPLVYLQR